MVKTAVLMATYNGAEYVKEQLYSLLSQTHSPDCILVRDDGSTDDTRELVSAMAREDARIVLLEEHHNLGVTQNFLRLLEAAGDAYDLYAFCDQDDVWLPHKIARAVAALEKNPKIPQLYFSRLAIVDRQLTIQGHSPIPMHRSFRNALSQNVVTGCTAVINCEARGLILRTPIAHRDVWSHDWWLYLVISYFGVLSYDTEQTILYRQHGGNVLGSQPNAFKQIVARIRSLSTKKLQHQRPSRLVKAFMEVYGKDIRDEDRRFLTVIGDKQLGLMGRLKAALSPRWQRQSFIDTMALRLRFLLGHY